MSAAVIAIGLIALPAMHRLRYDPRLSTGVIAASGTLAQILPPSLVLIVLAEQLDVSLQDMYRGALLPAGMLVLAYCLYVLLVTSRSPSHAPPAPPEDRRREAGFWVGIAISVGVPVMLIGTVLASVYSGVATPTEGGAIGVTATLAFSLVRRKLSGIELRRAMDVTGVLISSIFFLFIGASFFTLVFRGLGGQEWVAGAFALLPGGSISFAIYVNLIIFALAFFLEFFEIAFIVLPLIAPIARQLGVDMVWLAVLIALNLQTSFLHPPFGIALYNLRSIAPPTIRTADIYWGALPFILIQLALVVTLIAAPGLVLKREPPRVDPERSLEIPLPSLPAPWQND